MTHQLSVGSQMPTLARTIDITNMIAYAGSTWDWHRLHYDTEFLASKKIKAPIVDGQALGAIMAEAIQDWLGPDSFITRLHFRFSTMVFAGETVTCHGAVTEMIIILCSRQPEPRCASNGECLARCFHRRRS